MALGFRLSQVIPQRVRRFDDFEAESLLDLLFAEPRID
jgi:hypothetical protein